MQNSFKEEIRKRLDYEKEFEEEIEGTLMFIRRLSEKEIAEFIVYQNRAIDGLTNNNKSFVKAFSDKAHNQIMHPDQNSGSCTNKPVTT